MTPSPRLDALRREQLDRRLDRIRTMIGDLEEPPQGWVATLRLALGMTQAQLAARMGVTQSSIAQLERREIGGAVTLKTLEEAARALGGVLVYAVVPARSITETLRARAHRIARGMTRSVKHTMRLEGQETALGVEERIEALVAELLASPSRLWSMPDAD